MFDNLDATELWLSRLGVSPENPIKIVDSTGTETLGGRAVLYVIFLGRSGFYAFNGFNKLPDGSTSFSGVKAYNKSLLKNYKIDASCLRKATFVLRVINGHLVVLDGAGRELPADSLALGFPITAVVGENGMPLVLSEELVGG